LLVYFIPIPKRIKKCENYIDFMAKLTAKQLIYGYRQGVFPMDEDGTLYWYAPDSRAIIPLDTYKPAKSLRPILNKNSFEIRINCNFEAVMRGCAIPRSAMDSTWISEEIIEAYTDLHLLGFAHSVEAYSENKLVGGLYGVAIGSAFFGESMFHTVSNASKVAFHYLIQILLRQGYTLLDTQFINDNVRRFGAIEIPKATYYELLQDALKTQAHFTHVAVGSLL
jgi:leucyl/phenylalanyl-tRNA---protein transferase